MSNLVVTFKDKVELSKSEIERTMEKELTDKEWEDVKVDLDMEMGSIELMDFIYDVMDEIIYDYGQSNSFKSDEED
tara:strand:+ start:180 stop:407 length:228 start_codon:yes stop_codon:yes gene_type:complete